MSYPKRESIGPALMGQFAAFKEKDLHLDLTRGKPSDEQLDLSRAIICNANYLSRDGIDCRNYGEIEGLPEARELFADYLGVRAAQVFVLGNSSLNVMHDIVLQSYLEALRDDLMTGDGRVMICPVPGYDRHHTICSDYGIPMVPVPMTSEGPDIERIKWWVLGTPSVLGMWAVPKYSNPTGITFSEETCWELATMDAPEDFRIYWDLAYQGHHLTDQPHQLPNILDMAEAAGNPDRFLVFGSTSKITMASAGLALFASSEANLSWYRKLLFRSTIGQNKLDQLHHVQFLRDLSGIEEHMERHREIIGPKFEKVEEILDHTFRNSDFVSWSKPEGGYFVSVYLKQVSAKRVVELANELGVILTPAGAAFPLGRDPNDSHLRIAPTYPSLGDVSSAMEVTALCITIAAREAGVA